MQISKHKNDFIEKLLVDYDLIETDNNCLNNIGSALLEATNYKEPYVSSVEGEYYYIDFLSGEIYSWENESSDLDKANKAIGNTFNSFQEAKKFLLEVLSKNKIAEECTECGRRDLLEESNK